MRFGVLLCGRGASSSGVSRAGGLSLEQSSMEDGRMICCGNNGLILSNCVCVGLWVGMCVGYLG